MSSYQNKCRIDCAHIAYQHLGATRVVWDVIVDDQSLDVVATDTTPLSPLVIALSQNLPDHSDIDHLAQKLLIRTDNVRRMIHSSLSDMNEALNEVALRGAAATYDGRALTLNLVFRQRSVSTDHEVILTTPPGAKVSMEEFLSRNPSLTPTTSRISRRDVRRIYTAMKHIITVFPRAHSKNTPLRGLSEAPREDIDSSAS